ncbi:C-X-C chemokine receptor GPR25 [Microcaecilia unicolor]|uniref:Probable G-protein coupled receptor 25 n=1 Tax=Microcaecilia unicolor TaxID=1415580 RepID=A0A6P7ZU26_9AMPH|nr:probable G-protein coupled receptor 25 [Microcaecilia unicolor]
MAAPLPCTNGLSLETVVNDWNEIYDDYTTDENSMYHGVFSLPQCPQKELPYGHVYIPFLYSITFLVGVFGNLFVVVLMLRKQSSRRLVDTFVINLAIADLVFVCTLPFWAGAAAAGNQWLYGATLCIASSYSISVTRYSGTLFLMAMSLDRYLAIVRLHKSQALRTRGCIRTTSAGIWVISLLLGIPTLTSRRLLTDQETNRTVCSDICSEVQSGTKLALLFFTFLLPFAIILFCYWSVSARLRRHCQQGRNRRNSLKIIFTVVGTFLCSWLPFNTLSCIALFYKLEWVALSCRSSQALSWGLTLTACLAFTNSCVNPIIYTFLDRHFRQQILQKPVWLFQKPKAAETTPGSSITFSSQSSAFFPPRG